MRLLDGQRSLTISSAVWIECTNVTDRWTDTGPDHCYSYHRAVKSYKTFMVVFMCHGVVGQGRCILQKTQQKAESQPNFIANSKYITVFYVDYNLCITVPVTIITLLSTYLLHMGSMSI